MFEWTRCVNYVSRCREKMPGRSNLREQGFICAQFEGSCPCRHSDRVSSICVNTMVKQKVAFPRQDSDGGLIFKETSGSIVSTQPRV